jgi:spore coat polysaccharide biosynthesis predicted glycosyltransferase SpsG
MRCLSLAEACAEAGWAVTLSGQVPDFVAPRWAAFPTLTPNHDEQDVAHDWDDPTFLRALGDADVVITDLYALDDRWRARCRCPVLAVSDLPHWPHACALRLMPTLFPPHRRLAEGDPVPTLTGPDHCLIARDIRARRPQDAPACAEARLLISCGGGDDKGLAATLLRALAKDPAMVSVEGTVVLGALSPQGRAEARTVAEALPHLQVREKVTDMAALMEGHSVAFGTPAGAALERACMGMAQVLVPIVDNQLALAQGLASHHIAQVLPLGASGAQMTQALAPLLGQQQFRAQAAAQGWKTITGGGAAAVIRALDTILAQRDPQP